jgi:RHS repeat-associated protein
VSQTKSSPDRSGSRGAGRVSVGHPVDVASGNLFNAFEDFVLPGRMPVVMARRYSGKLVDRQGGLFGPGWFSPLEIFLRRTIDGYNMMQEEGEREVIFEDGEGAVEAGGVVRSMAECELWREGERYVVRKWDHETDDVEELVFGQVGPQPENALPRWKLLARQDLEGQGYELRYDADGQLLEIVQRREGRSLVLEHDAQGRLTAVHLRCRPPGEEVQERRVLRYGYDEAGRLEWMQDAEGQVCRHEYDAAGRMAREVNIGGMEYLFSYDASGRCIESQGADGYGQVKLEFADHAQVTLMTDALGNVTTYKWNAAGQVEQVIDPLGNTSSTVFDDKGRIAEEVSAKGRERRYGYDARGDRVEEVDGAGSVTRYAYNDRHQLVSVTDPAGHIWRRHHDDWNRVAAVENPLGEKLTYTYGDHGDLVAVDDALGARRWFEWNAVGDLVSATDWRGEHTRYEYDVEGNLLAVVDPLGHRTEATLDRLGRVKEVRLPDGAARRFSWDAYDQPAEYVDELGATTRWRYQHCGLLTDVERPHGGRLRFDWSAIPGQLLAVVNERGERYQLEYDGAGNLVSEQDFGGRRTRYGYNADGEVEQIHDAAGHQTEVERDDRGLVTAVRHDDGSSVEYAYDARGLLVTADNGQCSVERAYDAVSRLVRERQGEHTIESEYDAAGNRVLRRSSLGHVTQFGWDANGQLKSLQGPGDEPPLRFEYDARQDEVRRFAPRGVQIEQHWDARGRKAAQAVGVADGSTAVVHRRYGYDAASNLTEVVDQHWGGTRYSYDSLGRMLSAYLPGHIAEKLSYDATDNVTALSRQGAEGPPAEEGCAYGPGNVLLRRGEVEYAYDAVGQLTHKREGRDETRYEWNRFGQLAAVKLPDGSRWSYTYDPFGRRVQKRGALRTTEYVWDGDVVLHEVQRPTHVELDVMALRFGQPPPAEICIVNWEFDPDGFAPISKAEGERSYLCVNDVAGNPRELVTRQGEVVWRGLYSALGALVAEESKDGVRCPVRLQGQWADDETGLFYNRFRYYDPSVGRFISPDPIGLAGGMNVYTYPANTTGWIDPYGLATKKGKDGCNGSPKGANNPVVRRAAGTGQEAHRQIQKRLEDQEGYRREVPMYLPKAKRNVRKDAVKGDEVVIIKPDTPSGQASAQKREKLMKDEGHDTRVILYDPTDPAYQPGSPTFIGPKPKK